MSSPPASCWQAGKLPLGKPAKAQVTGMTPTTRGEMPLSPSILAAMLPGRAAMTAERNCGVSMKELTVSVLLLRRPS